MTLLAPKSMLLIFILLFLSLQIYQKNQTVPKCQLLIFVTVRVSRDSPAITSATTPNSPAFTSAITTTSPAFHLLSYPNNTTSHLHSPATHPLFYLLYHPTNTPAISPQPDPSLSSLVSRPSSLKFPFYLFRLFFNFKTPYFASHL